MSGEGFVAARRALAAKRQAVLKLRAPLFDPAHQRGLTSLLTQTYGKPVELNLRPVRRPYDDAEILASYATQQLRDRRSVVRRVIRDATWKAQLPSHSTIARLQQERVNRQANATPLTLAALTHAPAKTSQVLSELELSQVTSVQLSAAGRLSKRITANRAGGKVARNGRTNKSPAKYLRGVHKANVRHGFASGKRQIGAYGIKAKVGYT